MRARVCLNVLAYSRARVCLFMAGGGGGGGGGARGEDGGGAGGGGVVYVSVLHVRFQKEYRRLTDGPEVPRLQSPLSRTTFTRAATADRQRKEAPRSR